MYTKILSALELISIYLKFSAFIPRTENFPFPSHCEEQSDEAIFGEYGMLLLNEIAAACKQASQ